jgi:hypothetical protein
MELEIAPIIDDYWARDKFPFEIIPKLAHHSRCPPHARGRCNRCADNRPLHTATVHLSAD